MACEAWRKEMDAYIDGELEAAQAAALSDHLRDCAPCAASALEGVRLKRLVATAGRRYEPSAEFRAKFARRNNQAQRWGVWRWAFVFVPAMLILILSVGVNFYAGRENARRQRIYSELADLHVAALASATPVDVVSSDRHTVKPWFQGKIPFTFNLPEMQGSEFALLGGRVTYLAQTPGAHLIYQLRKHEISVFIFSDRGADTPLLQPGPVHALSFNMESWTQDGLRYFVVGDVNPADIEALGKMIRASR